MSHTPRTLNLPILPSSIANSPLLTLLLGVGLGSGSSATAASVCSRIGKMVKHEQRLIAQQGGLARDLALWLAQLPDEEARAVVELFRRCVDALRELEEALATRNRALQLEMSHVATREQRHAQLVARRMRQLRGVGDAESRQGATTKLALMREQLEQLDSSLVVVGDQYLRSVLRSLRVVMADYAFTMQAQAVQMRAAADEFAASVAAAEYTRPLNTELPRLPMPEKLRTATAANRMLLTRASDAVATTRPPSTVGKRYGLGEPPLRLPGSQPLAGSQLLPMAGEWM